MSNLRLHEDRPSADPLDSDVLAGDALIATEAHPSAQVIISEWSQGSNGGKEWVEFQVVGNDPNATVNLQDAVLADTNRTMARLQLSGAGFAELPVGTILVIYNGNDPDDRLAPKTSFDPDSGDLSLVIPSTNSRGDFAITATASTDGRSAWHSQSIAAFGNGNGGDVPVLMAPESGFFAADDAPVTYSEADAIATFYGILPINDRNQGTPDAPSVGSLGGGDSFHYLGRDITGIVTDANWSRDTNNTAPRGDSRTPGEPNAQIIVTTQDSTDAFGQTATSYSVVLRSQPTADVTITATPPDGLDLGAGLGVAAQITFTPRNWYVPQQLTASIDNLALDDSGVSSVAYTVASQNPASLYNSGNGVIVVVDGVVVAPAPPAPPPAEAPQVPFPEPTNPEPSDGDPTGQNPERQQPGSPDQNDNDVPDAVAPDPPEDGNTGSPSPPVPDVPSPNPPPERPPTSGPGGDGYTIFNDGDGDSQLLGSADDDVLNGGSGDDLIVGNIGDDILNGGGSADRLLGGRGDDLINGGSGHDVGRGGLGRDRLNGGTGGDRLLGNRSRDVLRGSGGNDTLWGGLGRDSLSGGRGRDRFAYRQRQEFGDTITDFGLFSDRIDLRRVNGVRSMDNIVLRQRNDNAIVRLVRGNGSVKTLAILEGIDADTLSSRHFLL